MPEQGGSREWGIGSRGESDPHSPLPTPHSPTPTPGQLAYEAFDAAFPADRFVRLTWDEQAPAVQRAWEAAAQAVLTMKQEEERDAFA